MEKESLDNITLVLGNPYDFVGKPFSAVGEYMAVLKNILKKEETNILFFKNTSESSQNKIKSSSSPTGRMLKNVLKQFSPYLYNSLVDYKYFKEQEKLEAETLNLGKTDLVVEFLVYGSDIGLKVAKSNDTDLVIIYDSPQLEQYKEMHKATSFYESKVSQREKQSLQNAKWIVCYSNPVKSYIVKNHRLDPSIIKVFPCINWNKLHEKKQIANKDSGILTIGFIGSFLPWHNVPLLVNAFENLSKKYDNISLTLIGKGIEWAKIRKMVDALDCKSKITMTGFISGESFLSIKESFDIGVVPSSNWYGSPLKIFEYGALKIPVVAPDVPTVVDIFEEGEDLLIINKDNMQNSLEQHLEELILSPDLRVKLGSSIYTKINTSYSIDKFKELWNEIVHTSPNKIS